MDIENCAYSFEGEYFDKNKEFWESDDLDPIDSFFISSLKVFHYSDTSESWLPFIASYEDVIFLPSFNGVKVGDVFLSSRVEWMERADDKPNNIISVFDIKKELNYTYLVFGNDEISLSVDINHIERYIKDIGAKYICNAFDDKHLMYDKCSFERNMVEKSHLKRCLRYYKEGFEDLSQEKLEREIEEGLHDMPSN